MIDNRFSAAAFQEAGYGSAKARALAQQLQDLVQRELDVALQPAFRNVVQRLNNLGHKLQPEGDLKPGDMMFREPLPGEPTKHRFLVAIDLVISVGYPDTVDATSQITS